jgi:hypothetical protein
VRVCHLFLDGLDDEASADLVAGQNVAERADVIRSALPLHVAQVSGVTDAEVVEGTQEFVVQGFPQSHLGGDTTVEELVLNVLAVHALRRGSQAQQLHRLEVINDLPVGR